MLRSVDAEFGAGTMTAVLGPNGSGKSTLLRLLLGLLRPTSGRVLFDGVPVRAVPPARRAAMLAYIPQSSGLIESFSVRQVVSFGRFARPHDPGAVEGALAKVGLVGRASEPFGTLSAGQQQRVTLARTLAQLAGTDPPPSRQAILADEPTGAMDPRHAMEAMAILREQCAAGRTIALVLHDVNMALRWADRALVLDADGAVSAAGPCRQTLTPETLKRVFRVGFERIGGEERGVLVPEKGETA